jgi:hypothetical protein
MIQKPVRFPVQFPFPRLRVIHRRLTITNGYTAAILIWKTSTPDPAEGQSKTAGWDRPTSVVQVWVVSAVLYSPHSSPRGSVFSRWPTGVALSQDLDWTRITTNLAVLMQVISASTSWFSKRPRWVGVLLFRLKPSLVDNSAIVLIARWRVRTNMWICNIRSYSLTYLDHTCIMLNICRI